MTRLLILILAALCATAIFEDGNLKHVGSQMFRVTPTNVHQVRYLHGIYKTNQYDFWSQPNVVGKSVDILATKWMIPVLKETLKMAKIHYEITIHDMYHAIKMSQIENENARAKFRAQHKTGESRAIDWTEYHDYDEIMEWADSLQVTYPDLVKVTDVGESYEGRTMKLVKVSTGGSGKPAIFTDAGIHAREWIAPATLTYILNELLSNSAAYQDVLDTVDFYFMPDINPDGYAYTWDPNGDRLWRKTRSPNPGLCLGTDPNRNWDFHWLESGASTSSCDETYAGPEPFSEVECRNVRDQMLAVAPDTKLYLTFHSYGQYLLYPWGYDAVDPPDVADLASLANDAADALRAVYGTVYDVGGSGTILYPAAGASDDYAKGVGGIKYSYTMELRPTGTLGGGFQLPPDQILPVCEETLEAFKVFMNFISDTYGKK